MFDYSGKTYSTNVNINVKLIVL